MRLSPALQRYRIPSLFVLLGWIVIMASCSYGGVEQAPEPTRIGASLTPSVTIEPTKTSTKIVTPTLGPRSVWRKSRIAFASNRTGDFQIFLIKPDGSEPTQITNVTGGNYSPVWSMDSKHIAFVSERDGNSEIYVMNPDGSKQTNISGNLSNDYSPIWLSNSRIAFISNRKGRERIFTMKPDGTDIVSFQYTSIESNKKIICLSGLSSEILGFTIEENSVRETRIVNLSNRDVVWPDFFKTKQDRSCPLVPNLNTNPWVFFISNRDGNDEIYKLQISDEKETQVTVNTSVGLGLTRSSDEDWIGFSSKQGGNWEIYIMSRDGKYQWNITNNSAQDIQPAWEPY